MLDTPLIWLYDLRHHKPFRWIILLSPGKWSCKIYTIFFKQGEWGNLIDILFTYTLWFWYWLFSGGFHIRRNPASTSRNILLIVSFKIQCINWRDILSFYDFKTFFSLLNWIHPVNKCCIVFQYDDIHEALLACW